jgi:Lon protease-like protein
MKHIKLFQTHAHSSYCLVDCFRKIPFFSMRRGNKMLLTLPHREIFLFVVTWTCWITRVNSWIIDADFREQRGIGSPLWSSSDVNEFSRDREKRRMELVRELQSSFYKSGNAHEPVSEPTLENGGVMQNLPVWRVQWWELPGRTNVLSIFEPVYTNMFEEIIRSEGPWYFGHLYLPGGSKNLRARDEQLKLKTWSEESMLDTQTEEKSAVLGTLMKITDFRRLEDGKILLLVQALERFVVNRIIEMVPYGIVDVQLLPDQEEIQLPKKNSNNELLEPVVQPARASALVNSWEKWHAFEYESTLLPLPNVQNMAISEVVGSAIAKVLPFASFDKTNLPTDEMKPPNMQLQKALRPNKQRTVILDRAEKPLEERLMSCGILHQAQIPQRLLDIELAELEINVWLTLNDYLKVTRTPVSPILLGLLPAYNWPQGFLLDKIANAIDHETNIEHKYVRVSPLYPCTRRQKRLSYSAAALLEKDPNEVQDIRKTLLQFPSTKLRLAYVLWMFETACGDFQ